MLKYLVTIILLGLFTTTYACKCGGVGTVTESYKATDLIVHGKVVTIDTVLLPETVTEDDARRIEENLMNDKKGLQYFKMTYVLKIGFEIVTKYKGRSDPKKVVIYTPVLSGTCGYRFKKDKEYIVYASTRNFLDFFFQEENETKIFEKENAFWTTHCTRTAEYSKQEAAELNLLKG